MKLTSILFIWFCVVLICDADLIQVNYTASISTVSGTPFGQVFTNGTPVTGFFTYDTSTPDVNPTANRGYYPHSANGAFEARFVGNTLSGSPTPYVQVEDFLAPVPDTWRFIDGPRTVGPQGGIMSWNGAPNADAQLTIAITDPTGTVFSNDMQPAVFPFLDAVPPFNWPHTFFISDPNGSLNLQFSTVAIPEPSSALLLLTGMGLVLLRRIRTPRS